MDVLGVDVGGSSIKAAVIAVDTGRLISKHLHVETPRPATPDAVVETIATLVRSFDWKGPVGCGFPAVMQGGLVKTAANIDSSWLGIDIRDALHRATNCRCFVINDADAAGLAEMMFGAGQGRMGTVLTLTLGTGIGSALFYRGKLFPNLELGSLPLDGAPAESYASAAVRISEKLSWQSWSHRLNRFLRHAERLFSPELIVVGGGISSQHQKFLPLLEMQAELVPAHFFNQAGIIGAACFAATGSHE